MKFPNVLQANDWEIKKFLKMVLIIQFLVLILIFSDFENLIEDFRIPLVRQIVVFIYLTFIPGMLFLRILRIHNLDSATTLCYSVGLSLALIMFSGLFANFFYPIFGVKPIKVESITITITLGVSFLSLVAYLRDKDFCRDGFICIKLSPQFLFVLLLPFISILGASLANVSNFLLIVLILAIATVPILVSFEIIPKELLPIAVFSISISLLYQSFFAAPYLVGQDIHLEYYFVNLVYSSSFWDISVEHQYNSLITNLFIPPIYSYLLSIPLMQTIKILYPFLFSLAAVAIFKVFEKQFDEKIAFFSCFLFISFYHNYNVMYIKHTSLIFFMSLILLALLNNQKNMFIIYIIFVFCFISSHYGLIYIFIIASCFVLIFKRFFIKEENDFKFRLITPHSIAFSSVLALSWHSFTSNALGIKTFGRALERIYFSFRELLEPLPGGAIYSLYLSLPWEWEVLKYLIIVTQLLSFYGIINVLYQKLNNFKTGISNNFFLYSLFFIALSLLGFIFPIFQHQTISLGRIIILFNIFLSPFCIIGAIFLVKNFNKVFKTQKITQNNLKLVAIFLTFFLLFNTQFIMEINREVFGSGYASSISLSQYRILNSENYYTKEVDRFFRNYPSLFDLLGAKWLERYWDPEKKILIDSYLYLMWSIFNSNKLIQISWNIDADAILKLENIYIFLGEVNLKYKLIIRDWSWENEPQNASQMIFTLEREKNKIYSNKFSQIYWT